MSVHSTLEKIDTDDIAGQWTDCDRKEISNFDQVDFETHVGHLNDNQLVAAYLGLKNNGKI